MRKFILLLVALSFFGAVGYAGFYGYWFLATPPDSHASERIVLIEQGTALRQAAAVLEDAAVIRDKNLFMILARFYRDGKSIKAGEYQFTTSMLPTEVLEKLQDGKIYFRTATIPEGYTNSQIAELLAQQGFGDKERFLELVFKEK